MLMVFLLHLYGVSYWPAIKWSGWFRDFGSAYHKSEIFFYPYTLGHLGVALFFVLSGYCIHLSFLNYLRKQKSAFTWPEFFKVFFLRRFFRIYPAYFAAVLFFFFWTKTYAQPDWFKHLFYHLTFLHNVRVDTYSSLNGAFWSLAYEWQLYCFYPVILLLRARLGMFKAFAIVALGSFAYSVIAAKFNGGFFPVEDAVLRSKYLFTWVLGAYLCEVHSEGRRLFPDSTRWLLAAIAVGLAVTEFKPALVVEWEIFAVIFAWTLEWYQDRVRHTLPERLLAGLGVISYSVYLLHGPLIEFFVHGPTGRILLFGYPYSQMTVSGLLFIFAPILALSWITYRTIEKPFHEFGLRLTSRAKPAGAPRTG